MLKEDYIMRLFQQFNEMLAKWLYKKRFDNLELVVSFNDEVVKPFLNKEIEFFEAMSVSEIEAYFTKIYPNENERLSRLEILAESLYQKALLVNYDADKKKCFALSLGVLELIDRDSKTYSLERESRMAELREKKDEF